MSEKFFFLCPKAFGGVVKTEVYLLIRTFWGTFFSEKKFCFFYSFLDIEDENSGLLSEVFGRVVKTAFYVTKGTFRRKKFSKKNSVIFVISERWAQFFGLLAKRIRHSCQNCSLSVHRRTLRNKVSTEILLSFLDIEWKSYGFCWRFLGVVVKTAC